MPTLGDPMDCSPPGSSSHGIFQARILEWVAISSLKGSFWSRDPTHVSCISSQILYHWATWKPLNKNMGKIDIVMASLTQIGFPLCYWAIIIYRKHLHFQAVRMSTLVFLWGHLILLIFTLFSSLVQSYIWCLWVVFPNYWKLLSLCWYIRKVFCLIFFSYWSTADLQGCVSFRHTEQQFSYAHICFGVIFPCRVLQNIE